MNETSTFSPTSKLARLLGIFIVLLGGHTLVAAGQGRSEVENLIKSRGANLYALAWPTAHYSGVAIEAVTLVNGWATATVQLRGKSAFDGGDLWVQASIEITNGKFTNLNWGQHSPSLFPPGTTVPDMADSLRKINIGKGPRDSIFASPEEVAAERRKWGPFNDLMKYNFDSYARSMQQYRRRLSKTQTWIYLQTKPECSGTVALHFKALDGRWVTMGWMKTGSDDPIAIDPIDRNLWVHVRTKNFYPLLEFNDRVLTLPVEPNRQFIRFDSQDLRSPDVKMFRFTKIQPYDGYGNRLNLACIPDKVSLWP